MNISNPIEVNPENFNKSVWKKDITKLPDITWRDVLIFLINTPSEFTKENTKAYKSLEAYKTYFLCGHVQDCWYAPSINEDYCFKLRLYFIFLFITLFETTSTRSIVEINIMSY